MPLLYIPVPFYFNPLTLVFCGGVFLPLPLSPILLYGSICYSYFKYPVLAAAPDSSQYFLSPPIPPFSCLFHISMPTLNTHILIFNEYLYLLNTYTLHTGAFLHLFYT